ncbi:MAG: response regulator, partial [Deltaproteobacteria bacterium]|nr:response regulator [Deltaproteobacteria bacterium]
MTEKVLVVDDERNVLEGIRRHLRKGFHIETALGSKEGLAAVKKNGPYAVIISDLSMPEMDGIQFLCRVRELAPDTVR